MEFIIVVVIFALVIFLVVYGCLWLAVEKIGGKKLPNVIKIILFIAVFVGVLIYNYRLRELPGKYSIDDEELEKMQQEFLLKQEKYKEE